jgi:hypothetical protein
VSYLAGGLWLSVRLLKLRGPVRQEETA